MIAAAYERISDAVTPLSDDDLIRPTRCRGWTVADLLFHVLLDAQRALVAFASPAPGPADVDFATYWRPFRPGTGEGARRRHARWTRIQASAYEEPSGVVRHWLDTAPAAVRAAAAAPVDGYVTTQGHVLSVPDFVTTLAVEAAVHHLDLVVDLPNAPPPAAEPLAAACATLDALLDGPRPPSWDDETYVLKGTGRLPLTADERSALGPVADRFPLLG
ncbi:maleylpyruvate isomerase family protein [Planosporangium thailandense]|uniref:Maleylpyruvate isomerase family protein n=1 Tax=Planosporangium thailandense TaxID=765197 RepID=A0ABX0XTF4_9ACTN|nr:maleylpyruvate isomerase family protein [Planosporangium thailandense]